MFFKERSEEVNKRMSIALLAANAALPEVGIENFVIVGSTYISDCTSGDVDVLCTIAIPEPHNVELPGWNYGGSTPLAGDSWCSFKREVDGVDVNILLCGSTEYVAKWLNAAEVCRFLYLRGEIITKAATHGVHAIIMDGTDAGQELVNRSYG